MKKKYLYLIILIPLLTLTGCLSAGGGEGGAISGGQGIDVVQLTKNPIVMLLIAGVVLYIAFKGNKK